MYLYRWNATTLIDVTQQPDQSRSSWCCRWITGCVNMRQRKKLHVSLITLSVYAGGGSVDSVGRTSLEPTQLTDGASQRAACCARFAARIASMSRDEGIGAFQLANGVSACADRHFATQPTMAQSPAKLADERSAAGGCGSPVAEWWQLAVSAEVGGELLKAREIN